MDTTTTENQIESLVDKAKGTLSNLKNKTESSTLGTAIKTELYASTDKIQAMLNNLLSKGGVISQEQVNSLDEELRLAKLNMLKAQSESSTKKFAIYVGLGVAVFGILWYLTKAKEKQLQ
jgi:hypothetical protein